MRTKRTFALTAILLGLLWSSDALAFYNPQTGRWLSRDPIGEAAFFHNHTRSHLVFAQAGLEQQALSPMYLFTGNNPVQAIDHLGLLVLLEAHPVALGHNHCYVVLMVDCGSRFWNDRRRFKHATANGHLRYATLGAGSKRSLLVSDVNRQTDANRANRNYTGVIRAPERVSDDEFIQMLFDADDNYPDFLLYSAFPAGIYYNSNGYASGLLNAVTGKMPQPPAGLSVPGFDHPVPHEYFGYDW